jgi:hypothetical protein
MNDSVKTFTFLGAAVVLLGVAVATTPRFADTTKIDDAGTAFYPEFKEPLKAKTLDIVEYDEDLATVTPFKVTQVNGVWSIPSHDNYPADAEQQLAAAAASLIDVKKLKLVSDVKGDQETYGVVDPTSKGLTGGQMGVGKRVELDDAEGKVLAAFIIGKSDEKDPNIHFVRTPGSDRIYRAEIKTDKLSTNFSDWIEKDLLKMNVFDFKRLTIDDHTVDALQGTLDQRAHITLDFDNKDSKWSVVKMQTKSGKQWTDNLLKEDEELNTQKLNDLKTALKDLKIIDVSRKPAGLSADLKADKNLASDEKAIRALMARGFFITKQGLFSNEGEVDADMNDGVEYVIRFGDIAGRDKPSDEQKPKDGEDKKNADEEKKEEASDGTSRYVFVTTRFNKDLIAKPTLEPLPEAGPAKPATEAPKGNAAPAATPAPEQTPEQTPEQPKDENKCDEPASPGSADPGSEPAKETNAAAAAPGPEKPAEKPAAEVDPVRAQIEKENKRKQDEYDDKVKAGEKRVKELNERFADWYYIISDATYRKIHLTRDDVVKKKEKPAEEKAAADAPAGK